MVSKAFAQTFAPTNPKPWKVITGYDSSGQWGAFVSNNNEPLNQNETSDAIMDFFIPNDGNKYYLNFLYITNIDENDKFELIINGEIKGTVIGYYNWRHSQDHLLLPGNVRIIWRFSKITVNQISNEESVPFSRCQIGRVRIVKKYMDQSFLLSDSLPSPSSPESMSSSEIMQWQQYLQQLNLYNGTIDGIWGPLTADAFRKYKKMIGSISRGIGDYEKNSIEDVIPHLSTGKQLSEHFNEDDFKCSHCGYVAVNPLLITMLEKLIDVLGGDVPLIHSGYRCPEYNSTLDGAAPNSLHTKGMAVDLHFPNHSDFEVFNEAEKLGFGGIHQYSWGLHLDIGPSRRW